MNLNEKKTNNSLSKLCCSVCHKEYTRKSSLDKHKLLCDYKIKTTLERQIDIEELGDIPNHYQLAKIVQELTLKMFKMEEKMEEMKKWVDKKKRKVNVISWLNINIIPTIGFLEWVKISFVIKEEDFISLIDNTLFHTVQQIFEYNLCEKNDFIYPIKCFTQKQGNFYICEKKPDGSPEWKPLELQDMVLLMKTIQRGLINQLTNWKKDKQQEFGDNDKMAILFNKTVIKLMSISFTQDNTLSRIKNNLYNYLKAELTISDQQLEF